MEKALGDIASIQTGIHFRKNITDYLVDGGIPVLSFKDVEGVDLDVISKDVLKIDPKLAQKALLQPDDLIIKTRGEVFSSTRFVLKKTECAFSAPLFSVRVFNPALILPEFLNCWFSTDDAQQQMGKYAAGTSVQTVNRAGLELLQVSIPSLSNQKKCIEYYSLASKELNILHSLVIKKRIFLTTILNQYIKGNQDGY